VRSDDRYPDSLHELLDARADASPDAALVRFLAEHEGHDQIFTRAAIRDESLRFASGLHQAGIARGARVVIMLGNVPAFLFAWLGSSYAGAVSVPLSQEQRGAVLKSMLEQSNP